MRQTYINAKKRAGSGEADSKLKHNLNWVKISTKDSVINLPPLNVTTPTQLKQFVIQNPKGAEEIPFLDLVEQQK